MQNLKGSNSTLNTLLFQIKFLKFKEHLVRAIRENASEPKILRLVRIESFEIKILLVRAVHENFRAVLVNPG